MPARQSSWSTSTTARGRVSLEREGKTAWATAAASATGSAPATRVVFLVAKTGKPSVVGPAGFSSPRWPSTGVACSVGEAVAVSAPAAAARQRERERDEDGGERAHATHARGRRSAAAIDMARFKRFDKSPIRGRSARVPGE